MNSEERTKLREWLLGEGFRRTAYTDDDGDGRYAEFWSRGNDEVILRWGKRGT